MTDLVLAGYFGFGNAGDEMISRTVRRAVPGADWTVLGQDASRWNPVSLTLRFRLARALVYGGGELFQVRTSARSILYYLALPRLARLCGAQFLAYGMGIDPDLPEVWRRPLARVFDQARRIWFRDDESLSIYRAAGGKAPASVAPDPVWGWPAESRPSPAALRRILWIPRRDLPRKRLSELMSKSGAAPAVLPLHPAEDLRELRGLPGIERWESIDELPAVIAGFDAVVTMRYHGLVLAALAGRPAVALAAHGKVGGLARALNAPILPPDASAARVSEALSEAFARRAEVPGRAAALREAASAGLRELKDELETFR